jgi:hypothetical protein
LALALPLALVLALALVLVLVLALALVLVLVLALALSVRSSAATRGKLSRCLNVSTKSVLSAASPTAAVGFLGVSFT